MSATEIHQHLRELEAERMFASLEGLSADRGYMADLTDEIAATRAAYVGSAVTEIAVLRAELWGRPAG